MKFLETFKGVVAIISQLPVEKIFLQRPYIEAKAPFVTGSNISQEIPGIATPEAEVPSQSEYSGASQISAAGKACIPCVLPEAIIASNPSVKDMREIELGEKVLDLNGSYSVVTEVMSRYYEGEMISIKVPYQNERVTLTPEHPVLMVRAKSCRGMPVSGSLCFPGKDNPRCCECRFIREYTPEWVDAKDLKPGDLLLMPRVSSEIDVESLDITQYIETGYYDAGDGYIKPVKNNAHNRGWAAIPIRRTIEVNSDFLKLAGFYLAEGSVLEKKRGYELRLDFGKHEPQLAEESADLIQKVFGCKAKIKPTGTALRVYVCSNILGQFFSRLFGKGALGKKIPQFIITLPNSKKSHFTQGYWLGDGHGGRGHSLNSTSFNASTVSRQLAYSMRLILHSMGIIHSLSRYPVKDSNIKGRPVKSNGYKYVLYINGPSAIKFADMTGQKHYPWRFLQSHLAGIDERWVYLPIQNLDKFHYSGEVRNLRTEPSNTYTVAGVITHNCGNDHFSTASNLLAEAKRFALDNKSLDHPEIILRIAHAEDELNGFEREDGSPSKVAELPPDEKGLMDEMLIASRQLRHELKELNSGSSLEDIERVGALADQVRGNFRTRLFRMQMAKLDPVQKSQVENKVREITEGGLVKQNDASTWTSKNG